MKVHEVDEDTLILELEPTQYYHLWNKWDLYQYLMSGSEKMTFYTEDFPLKKEDLIKYTQQLKNK
jgi:hypothetical protein